MPFDDAPFEQLNRPLGSEQVADASSILAAENSELERSLPDDLLLLAEQLSDDALHLSALYPPRAPDEWKRQLLLASESVSAAGDALPAGDQASRRWGWRDVLRAKAALAAASVLLAATLAWQSMQPTSDPVPAVVDPNDATEVMFAKQSLQQSAANEAKKSATKVLTAFHPVVNQPASDDRVIGTPRVENEMVPAGLFLTLSGPEQEAMLDLIEDAKLQQPSVSF